MEAATSHEQNFLLGLDHMIKWLLLRQIRFKKNMPYKNIKGNNKKGTKNSVLNIVFFIILGNQFSEWKCY